MVLRMIHEQDSLLAMGKFWPLDFVGADIDTLYIVFVTWRFNFYWMLQGLAHGAWIAIPSESICANPSRNHPHDQHDPHYPHIPPSSAVILDFRAFFSTNLRALFRIHDISGCFFGSKVCACGNSFQPFKRWIGSMSFDPKVLAIASGALGFLYIMAVEPLNPRSKRQEGYNPEPYAFQWKARFDEWMGWKPQTRL